MGLIKTTSKRKRAAPNNTLEDYNEEMKFYYLGMNYTVKEVRDTMETNYGFGATLVQYRERLNKWGFKKRGTKRQWRAIANATISRGEDKQTDVVMNGDYLISSKRVKREIARKFTLTELALMKTKANQYGMANTKAPLSPGLSDIDIRSPISDAVMLQNIGIYQIPSRILNSIPIRVSDPHILKLCHESIRERRQVTLQLGFVANTGYFKVLRLLLYRLSNRILEFHEISDLFDQVISEGYRQSLKLMLSINTVSAKAACRNALPILVIRKDLELIQNIFSNQSSIGITWIEILAQLAQNWGDKAGWRNINKAGKWFLQELYRLKRLPKTAAEAAQLLLSCIEYDRMDIFFSLWNPGLSAEKIQQIFFTTQGHYALDNDNFVVVSQLLDLGFRLGIEDLAKKYLDIEKIAIYSPLFNAPVKLEDISALSPPCYFLQNVHQISDCLVLAGDIIPHLKRYHCSQESRYDFFIELFRRISKALKTRLANDGPPTYNIPIESRACYTNKREGGSPPHTLIGPVNKINIGPTRNFSCFDRGFFESDSLDGKSFDGRTLRTSGMYMYIPNGYICTKKRKEIWVFSARVQNLHPPRQIFRSFLEPRMTDAIPIQLPINATSVHSYTPLTRHRENGEESNRTLSRALSTGNWTTADSVHVNIRGLRNIDLTNYIQDILEFFGRVAPRSKISSEGKRWIERLLIMGAGVNHRPQIYWWCQEWSVQRTRTLIQVAADWFNDIEILQLLLAYGADVNAVGVGSMGTALQGCCRAATSLTRPKTTRIECVRLLVEAGANINALTGTGKRPRYTALDGAIISGDLAVVRYLLEQGAYVDVCTIDYAIRCGRLDSVSLLVQFMPTHYDTAIKLSQRFGEVLIEEYLVGWRRGEEFGCTPSDHLLGAYVGRVEDIADDSE